MHPALSVRGPDGYGCAALTDGCAAHKAPAAKQLARRKKARTEFSARPKKYLVRELEKLAMDGRTQRWPGKTIGTASPRLDPDERSRWSFLLTQPLLQETPRWCAGTSGRKKHTPPRPQHSLGSFFPALEQNINTRHRTQRGKHEKEVPLEGRTLRTLGSRAHLHGGPGGNKSEKRSRRMQTLDLTQKKIIEAGEKVHLYAGGRLMSTVEGGSIFLRRSLRRA